MKGLNLGSGKEWRSHLEATRRHQNTIEKILPATSKQLDSIGASTGEMLDRVTQREKYINNQYEHLKDEYKATKAKLDELTSVYQSTSENIGGLTNELAMLNDKVEEIKVIIYANMSFTLYSSIVAH